MIKYFAKPGVSSMIAFNTDTEEINTVDYINSGIDWIYQVPTDGVLQLNNGEKNVKKGDIVIKFYERTEYNMTPVIVIKSTEWKNNILNKHKYEEEARLKRDCACEDCAKDLCCDDASC